MVTYGRVNFHPGTIHKGENMSEQGKQYEPRRICAGDGGAEVWAWYAGGSDPSGPYELPPDVFAALVPTVVPGWPDAVTFPSREDAMAALERATRKAKGESTSEQTTFTPGPYHVIPGNPKAGDGSHGPFIQADDGDEGIIVAEVPEGPPAEFNATLFAAAPDLLAACETVAIALQWHAEQDPTSTLAEALRAATAAIRKARGES